MSSAWGSSWGKAWGSAWGSITSIVVDTHDGGKKAREYRKKRERLLEDIQRAFSEITGEFPKEQEFRQKLVSVKTHPNVSRMMAELKTLERQISEMDEEEEALLCLLCT